MLRGRGLSGQPRVRDHVERLAVRRARQHHRRVLVGGAHAVAQRKPVRVAVSGAVSGANAGADHESEREPIRESVRESECEPIHEPIRESVQVADGGRSR